MIFLSLYTILLVLVQAKVNAEENKSAELPGTKCTNTYYVSHDRQKPFWYLYGIKAKRDKSSTPETCQDWCNKDVRCRSVKYTIHVDGWRDCQKYSISVQELKDTGRDNEIYTETDTDLFPTYITFDRFCGTLSTTTSVAVSTPRPSTTTSTSTVKPTTTTSTSTVKPALPSTSASPPPQDLTTSTPQTSGGTITTTDKPDDTNRILIYIIAGVCGLVLTVLVAMALLVKKRLSKTKKRVENVESASGTSEENSEENSSPVDKENSSFPETWPQYCDSNSDKTVSPPQYSEDSETYPSLPSSDTYSPQSLRDVVAQMQKSQGINY